NEALNGHITNPYDSSYQNMIGKDLLNAVIFSLAAVDFVSPFNKITVAGRRYSKDRGYAFDQELEAITNGLLAPKIADYQALEAAGKTPLLLISATIINDGRKLLISPQPISYLTRPAGSSETTPIIDAVDFC